MQTGFVYPVFDQKGRRVGFQARGGDGSIRGGLIGVPGLQTFRQSDQELAEQARLEKEARELMGPPRKNSQGEAGWRFKKMNGEGNVVTASPLSASINRNQQTVLAGCIFLYLKNKR